MSFQKPTFHPGTPHNLNYTLEESWDFALRAVACLSADNKVRKKNGVLLFKIPDKINEYLSSLDPYGEYDRHITPEEFYEKYLLSIWATTSQIIVIDKTEITKEANILIGFLSKLPIVEFRTTYFFEYIDFSILKINSFLEKYGNKLSKKEYLDIVIDQIYGFILYFIDVSRLKGVPEEYKKGLFKAKSEVEENIIGFLKANNIDTTTLDFQDKHKSDLFVRLALLEK